MRDAILAWYDRQGRSLAFRGTRDPYAILVSEAMAQQTQVTRAAEAWGRFLAAFPTFTALAAASPAEVLRAWRGLGYNRRALALRRTAIEVVTRHGGGLPSDVTALEQLPGIGPYTARAVAALAFGAPVGAVDTNVRRVLIRTLTGDPSAWRAGPGTALPARMLQGMADAAVPADRPGDWTHAVMDVGARFCRPRLPTCADCPARPWCRTAAIRPATWDTGGAVDIGQASGGPAGPPRARKAAVPFAATSRWLRGRIMDRLRDGADGEWVDLGAGIGGHPPEAVVVSLAALEREGLAQRHPHHPARARLPLA